MRGLPSGVPNAVEDTVAFLREFLSPQDSLHHRQEVWGWGGGTRAPLVAGQPFVQVELDSPLSPPFS